MPDVVEIYIFKSGQKLEERKLMISRDIADKDAAKEDAERRFTISPSVDRIAYYGVFGAVYYKSPVKFP